MAGKRVKFSYKQLHIMKHALMEYVEREDISETDFISEKNLLAKIENEIREMKELHGIVEKTTSMQVHWVVMFQDGTDEIMTEQVHAEFSIGMHGRKRVPICESEFSSYKEARRYFPNASVSY